MRIIAGNFKGRKLLSPPGKSPTRPMTGRVKESIFGTLRADLPDAVVLDLYCGTGTLGLEALSRGSGRCYFAERDAAVIDRLRRNIEAVGVADQCSIWRCDIEKRLASLLGKLDEQVDIAFLDPPYQTARSWDWQVAVTRIFAPLAERLASDGVIVLRTPGGLSTPESLGGLVVERVKHYGDMTVTMYGLEVK